MKTKNLLPWLLLAASVILGVLSFLLLPETVVTQFGAGGKVTTMPKLFAVGLPLALGAGGAVAALFAKQGETAPGKALLVSAVGIVVFVVMLVVNL